MDLKNGLNGRRGVTPTDKVFLAFLAVDTAVIFVNASRLTLLPLLLLVNAAAVGLVALAARLPAAMPAWMRWLSTTYPLILTLAFYTQIGLIHQDVGRLHDTAVQAWDRALFGSDISVTWHRRMPSAALSSILHFCYAAFYPMVLLPPFLLFVRASREQFDRAMLELTLTLYICYATFALFPVAGPRYFWGAATGPEAGVPMARFVHDVLEGGSAYGTAFPSSHIAASWCAVAILVPTHPRLALVLSPIAVGLALGTVYGQFHYGVDALAGGLLALLLYLFVQRRPGGLQAGRP